MQSPWLSRRLESFQRASGDHTLNFDQKKCWEATEDHFVCLDKHHDVYGTPPSSFLPPNPAHPR